MKTAEEYLQGLFGDEWLADFLSLSSTSLLQAMNAYGDYRDNNATGYSIPCDSTLPGQKEEKKENAGNGINSPIDYVLTNELELAVRLSGKRIDYDTVDKIIDLVELMMKTKGKVTLKHLVSLQKEWKRG